MIFLPLPVQEAWDNHFEAFGSQNLDKIMLDYDEKSVLRCFCHSDGSDDTFTGVEEIRGFFDGLFKMLSDLRSAVQTGSNIPRVYILLRLLVTSIKHVLIKYFVRLLRSSARLQTSDALHTPHGNPAFLLSSTARFLQQIEVKT